MSKILLFVHGTGVRKAGYDSSMELIKRQLVAYHCNVRLEGCFWGGSVGATLPDECRSVPGYGNTRSIGNTAEDDDLALWNLLCREPTAELGMLATSGGVMAAYPPNLPHPGVQLCAQFAGLQHHPELVRAVADLAPDHTAASILSLISGSPAYAAAEQCGAAATPSHAAALARAVVATLQYLALEQGLPVYDAHGSNALATQLGQALGSNVRGPVGAGLTSLLSWGATWYSRARRGRLTDQGYAAAGDILCYQSRGDALRDFLLNKIAEFPDDQVILFAHSLGGIASFETLIQHQPANVAKLITFGSQSPFLYEMDALSKLRRNAELPVSLPDLFPPWSNFYDLNDPLSYLAGKLFDSRVSDHEVKSGMPFPAAHSAYLRNEPFWHLVSSKVALV
ncbi:MULTISPECIES: hypothetical protein [unclassified Janthinobacterium]|uniref:hypothetical protein n=1 Tax=unclassified Janthinobacterium TaxID=2610881 RepID=UPI00088F8E32|nr:MULTISPECIES: hypothetical protein [unclassified Janthinobacterium]SDA57580.1 hypothetical protein SAMN03159349_02126 [Janthinobacterium sp. 551a]SFB28650.1 hypothetical protein SAMN03159300_103131 [Janthinobacterium sp. 344]